MERVCIIGLDRYDNNQQAQFFCKGILLNKMGYNVDFIYSQKYELIDEKKYNYLKGLHDFNLIQFKENIDFEKIKETLLTSDFVIFNPMEYSLSLLDKLKELDINLYLDLSYFSAKDKDFASLSSKTKATMFLSRHNHDKKIDIVKNIMLNSPNTDVIFFKNNGDITIQSSTSNYFTKLFLDETDEELYLESNIFFTGYILAKEMKKDLTTASHYGISLCDLLKIDDPAVYNNLDLKTLELRVHEEFEELDEDI